MEVTAIGGDHLIAEFKNGNGTIHERRANSHRVVDCINACTGMSDPAAEIAAKDARIKALEGQLAHIAVLALLTQPDLPPTKLSASHA